MSVKAEHEYRPKWRWPPDVRHYVREKIDGHTLNVCAGESGIGDVAVDKDPERGPDVVADMTSLPFDQDTFDSVVSDPPWKLAYFDRFRPFYECVRVCKPGGTVVYNAKWVPESNEARLVEKRIRSDAPWRDTSVITVWEPLQERLGRWCE